MTKKGYTCLLLLWIYGLIIIQAGCGTATTGKQAPLPNEPVAQFPKMIIGDKWVVKLFIEDEGIITRNATVIETEPDGSFVLEIKDSNGRTLLWYLNNRHELVRGVNVTKGAPIKLSSSPPKRLEFPLFVGKKWSDEFDAPAKSGGFVHITNKYMVEAFETVTTEAGSFKAFKIMKHQQHPRRGLRKEEYWYAPEAKYIVKSVPEWSYGSELISFNVALIDKPTTTQKPKIVVKGDKVKIGIIDFQSLNDEAKQSNLGKVVSEMLTTSFVNSEAFKILERQQLENLVKEFRLSASGIIDTSDAKEIGKLAGADAIVTGSVIQIGDELRLDARIIEVESGIILFAEKSEGTVNIKSIGMMAESIVSTLAYKFYQDR
jgi:TolB-like protein